MKIIMLEDKQARDLETLTCLGDSDKERLARLISLAVEMKRKGIVEINNKPVITLGDDNES